MTRRQLETSETWKLVKAKLDQRISELLLDIVDETDDADVHRCQGALKELVALRDEFPDSFPDEIVQGRSEKDPVAEVLDGKH